MQNENGRGGSFIGNGLPVNEGRLEEGEGYADETAGGDPA